MRISLMLGFATAVCFAIGCDPSGSNNDPLKYKLELAQRNAVAAMISGDSGQVQKATSAYFFGAVQAMHESGKDDAAFYKQMGENLRQNINDPNWKFLRTASKGPTAALVRWRDIPPEESKEPKFEIGIMGFAQENGEWKIDHIATVERLRTDSEGKPASPETFNLGEEEPSGIVRPAPTIRPKSEVEARVNLFSSSGEAILIVNGNRQKATTSSDGPVIGGLKRGKNSVRIELADPKTAGRMLNCKIYIGGFGDKAITVFEYNTQAAPATLDAEFDIDQNQPARF
ncbi:hypothetical protein BH10PLA1_BH10PLA1_04900 [soil metagenome]